MTFAQALARIEELIQIKVETKASHYTHSEWVDSCFEFDELLRQHADSIVQLGKLAKRLTDSIQIEGEPYSLYCCEMDVRAAKDLIKLLKGMRGET